MAYCDELPEDYDISPADVETEAASATVGTAATAGALRRGFFSQPRPLKSAVNAEVATAVSSADTAAGVAAPGAAAPVAAAPASSQAVSAPDVAERDEACAMGAVRELPGNAAEILEGLRLRLRASADKASAARREAVGSVAKELEGLEELLTPLQAKWPTAGAKSSRNTASSNIEAALAELRAASGDARRLHSGEERRAAAELRRVAEDVAERVRKVTEAAAQQQPAREERLRAAAAAFHGLPLVAKLRALADERLGLALLGGSFLAGAVLFLAMLAEVHVAWNCGFRCSR